MVIEMAGIAGAGKTTLRKLLSERDGRFKYTALLNKSSYIPAIMRNTTRWLPIYLKNYSHGRWFTWYEIKLMTLLETWPPHLIRQTRCNDFIIVIDPGSVYWLARLSAFGPEITKSRQYDKWWNSKLNEWSFTLNAIIWLDAPDEILIDRILSRDEQYQVKRQVQKNPHELFKGLRKGITKVIDAMIIYNSIKVFRFCTDLASPEEMADKVLEGINFNGGQGLKEI